ncbi:WD repeat-containing protein WRAP73 isoform X1 [Sphaerodactylus townsendi]|uniref:WD repeat-containing protein WRAP73 isoform X1 n=1 Tax=Sphaerodactylus townsendi TaxID=933632 RepID=UPI002027268B|nr:WD repeat-containing protein WRAP73 isoform X1 [Sphaerodactylus townsendi]
MNFSECFKLSSQLCKFSPDGKFLASGVQYRLVVRSTNTLQILQLFTCLDQIQHIEWSSDSLFILCAMYKRGIVQVWSLEQPDWHCKVDEGSAGLVASCWSPDGRHILNTTEFHLRITVWSLCTKSVSYIKYPKACQQGIAFTKDGRYMALAERRDCKDYISLFVCSDWQLLRHFDTETQDIAGIEWAPNGCVLAVWDTCLEYKILLYSLDGRLLSTYRAYEWSLGIKSVSWSPSSQFLAIGSYDEKVRILNHVTWKKIADFEHPVTVASPKTVVYKETEKSPAVEMDKLLFPPSKTEASSLFSTKSKYEITPLPVSLHNVKPAADRANPRIGVGMLAFSSDNCFLATRNDNIPNAVWIWDMQQMKLFVVLEQLCTVQLFQWDPQQSRLAICTANSRVYLWSPAGCVSVQVPMEGDFQVISLCWHSSGNSLALMSKENFCLCYLESEAEEVK